MQGDLQNISPIVGGNFQCGDGIKQTQCSDDLYKHHAVHGKLVFIVQQSQYSNFHNCKVV